MSKPMTTAEATLAIKQRITDVLVELGAEDDAAPSADEIEAARDIAEILWDTMEMRVTSIGEVTGMINLGIPVNILSR